MGEAGGGWEGAGGVREGRAREAWGTGDVARGAWGMEGALVRGAADPGCKPTSTAARDTSVR